VATRQEPDREDDTRSRLLDAAFDCKACVGFAERWLQAFEPLEGRCNLAGDVGAEVEVACIRPQLLQGPHKQAHGALGGQGFRSAAQQPADNQREDKYETSQACENPELFILRHGSARFGPAWGRAGLRVLISSLFLLAGLHKLQQWDESALAMARHGLPLVGPLLAAAVVVELGAGFGLLIGFRTRVMALVLFAFTLTVNFVLHDFWAVGASDAARIEMQLFAKNIAIAGGLLVLVGLGGGAWSYDKFKGEA
jgi:putative oxidoreductase